MPAEKTWKEFTLNLIEKFCSENKKKLFTLQEFQSYYFDEIRNFKPTNNNSEAKIRQQLQFLRNEAYLSFLGKGQYEFHGDYQAPQADDNSIEDAGRSFLPYMSVMPSSGEEKIKKEYQIETYARDRGWVKRAKEIFGHNCLFSECTNRFLKPNGEAYIEVRHIRPLYENGNDTPNNLSVLCAHHHKMAHFADLETRNDLKKFLLETVEKILSGKGSGFA